MGLGNKESLENIGDLIVEMAIVYASLVDPVIRAGLRAERESSQLKDGIPESDAQYPGEMPQATYPN